MREDHGIATLIDLHDQVIDQGGGYWIKIEARVVDASTDIPHGIRYSLTLHEPYGKRILGYDNAHAVKPPKKFKYAGTRLPYDHSIDMLVIKVCPMSSKMHTSCYRTSLWKWTVC